MNAVMLKAFAFHKKNLIVKCVCFNCLGNFDSKFDEDEMRKLSFCVVQFCINFKFTFFELDLIELTIQ